MATRIFQVIVVPRKDMEVKKYQVVAKNDVVARQRGIARWVREMNDWLAEARGDVEARGEKPPKAAAYSERDVDYCEVRLLNEAT